MRRPRLKAPVHLPAAYYHVVSRIVNRDFVCGDEENAKLLEYIRLYERFCQVRVLAYCLMSNHFHLLVEVPKRPDPEHLPDDAGLVAHVRSTLGDKGADHLEWELAHLRGIGAHEAAEILRQRWFGRMWDISSFMKTLKQRFTQWFNGRRKRRGTLWEDRFRSVLVEGKGNALRAMAAYIDLNPVRAKICDDPKDYRWCGYAEAVAGGRLAREALRWLAALNPYGGMKPEIPTAKAALENWRCFLFGVPESEAARAEQAAKGDMVEIWRRRIPREKALEVLRQGGRLPQAEYLRCRVRYLTDGAVLGGREFVEGIFEALRDRFAPGRKDGARPLRGLALAKKPDRLYNLRQLQTDVFG